MAKVEEFVLHSFSEEDIDDAIGIVRKKFAHINAKAPDGSIRSTRRTQANIFHGSLAQIAVESLLLSYGVKDVQIYDKVRVDGFRYPDPWDLNATVWGAGRLIEVRSSYLTATCAKGSTQDVLRCIHHNYNIITNYKASYKLGESEKSIFIQVYWPYMQEDAESFFVQCESGKRPKLLPECFIVGLSTRKLNISKGYESTLGQRGATYTLVKISDAYPCRILGPDFV